MGFVLLSALLSVVNGQGRADSAVTAATLNVVFDHENPRAVEALATNEEVSEFYIFMLRNGCIGSIEYTIGHTI
jgi:hypothetical protein